MINNGWYDYATYAVFSISPLRQNKVRVGCRVKWRCSRVIDSFSAKFLCGKKSCDLFDLEWSLVSTRKSYLDFCSFVIFKTKVGVVVLVDRAYCSKNRRLLASKTSRVKTAQWKTQHGWASQDPLKVHKTVFFW